MFNNLADDIKKFLQQQAANAVKTAQGVADYVGYKAPPAAPNPLKDPKGYIKNQFVDQPIANAKNAWNLVTEGLNVATSYPLGGAIRGGREQLTGTYVPPKTGVKFRITPIAGPNKGKPQETDLGEYLHPSLVGIYRGITQKQSLMEEAPKVAGVKSDSLPGLAIGLVAEVAAPGVGGEAKSAKAIKDAPEVQKVVRTIIGKKGDDFNKARSFIVSLINKATSDEDAAVKIKKVVDEAIEKGDEKIAKNIQTALQSQLMRFGREQQNPNAQKFFAELKTGVERLNTISGNKTTAKSILEGVKQTTYQSAKKEFDDFMALQRTRTPSTRNYISDIGAAIKTNTTSPLTDNIDALSDLKNWRAGNSDFVRNFEQVFGDKIADAKRLLLDPFDKSKARMVDDYTKWRGELEENIVKKFGIKDKSDESAAIQLYGEKKMSLEDLQRELPKSWEKVVEAERWFRAKYDELLNEVNTARRAIYGDNPEKIIPARSDYFRHFREMQEGFAGLKNIFDTPAGISSNLAGVSDFTKPKSKFLSFAQKREGEKTAIDAVGGFLDYIKAASFAKNVDPQIQGFRGLAEELAAKTADGPNKGKLNNFIEYLQDFANDLSGKTNPGDRAIQKWIPGGRQTMKVVEWMSNRFKTNAVLGNISSTIMQSASLPLGIADVGPRNFAMGAFDTIASIFRGELPQQAKSTFLKERWFNPEDTFSPSVIDNAKNFTAAMMRVVDGTATRTIWNGEYRKALQAGAKTVDEAARAADYATRKIVAGRGIGEVPLNQKARTIQLIAPFQLEVANQWLVMKDWMDEKTFSKFITLFVSTHLFNNAMEPMTGNRPLLDPIEAISDAIGAYDEEADTGDGLKRAVGRMAGEVLSNLPYAQVVLAGLPEYGNIPGVGMTKKEFFGEADPTRFGQGIPLAKAFSSPENFVTGLVTPFGGAQIKKTLKGFGALVEGGVYNKEGQLQYPVGPDLGSKLQTLVFGPYATETGQFYFDNNLRNFSDKETAAWEARVGRGEDPVNAWMKIQRRKVITGIPEKIREVMNDDTLTRDQKRTEVQNIRLKADSVVNRIDAFIGEDGEDIGAFDAEQEASLDELKEKSKAKFLVGGKKGKKPPAPSMPKYTYKQSIKGNAPKTFEYNFDNIETDIEQLKKLGTMPPIDLSFS